MKKIAIFVEGQTEMLFVRKLIVEIFEYNHNKVCIQCLNIFRDDKKNNLGNQYERTDSFPCQNPLKKYRPKYFFQIANVGSDVNVTRRIIESYERLFSHKVGFHLVLGLKDMYSSEYKKKVKNRVISEKVNRKFIEITNKTIKQRCKKHSDKIQIHYAIMETEAWLLGLKTVFPKIDVQLSTTFIQQKLGFDLEKINPETAFFHPTNQMKAILGLIGEQYDKSEKVLNNIMKKLKKEDFKTLLESENCSSFSHFYQSLSIGTL